MSFWGATVITNLLSVIPFIGQEIVYWLWGGFSVDQAVLKKFFSLHFLLPFIILAVAFIHIIVLHQNGSTNPLGMESKPWSKISFSPYFLIKDYLGLFGLIIVYIGLVIVAPEAAGHPDNNIQANPLVTPPHIVPEWYFLPYFAILRSVSSKLLGVLLMVAAIFILTMIPVLNKPIHRSGQFRPGHHIVFFIQVSCFFILGYIGAQEAVQPYILVSQVCTALYFATFLIMIPLQVAYENFLYESTSKLIKNN
jgi:quinol-cytochrome oxidoreductase complex cytochrome b subunit